MSDIRSSGGRSLFEPRHGRTPAAGHSWRQASDVDLTGFIPGFDQPPVGARSLAMGRWIIDCGHDNYQTELHPLSFLSWVRSTGSGTAAIEG